MTTALTLTPEPRTDWHASLRFGYLVLFLSVGLCGSWAAFAHINSAVVAAGIFSVESYRKTIQHLEGGIVADILVRDGDPVEEGQTLIRLDSTRIEATVASVAKSLAGALATEARLTAQRDMVDYMVVPEEAETLLRGFGTAEIEDNHREFESRRQVLSGSLELLDAQEKQLRNETNQNRADGQTASEQLQSITRELGSLRPLLAKGLVAMSRVTTLERQKLQYESALKKSRNDEVKNADRVQELRLRKEAVRKDYRQEASKELVEVGRMIAQYRQERQIALDMLSRTEIRSPVKGTVQQVRVFTVGGVVRPGEPILDIVPVSDVLIIKAKISPADIDRIKEGMDVEIHLNALMKYRRERIVGTLRFVSRDVITEPNPNTPPYFSVEVAMASASIPADVQDRLIAGMEASVVIPTEGRTVLEYIVAPVMKNIEESLRER